MLNYLKHIIYKLFNPDDNGFIEANPEPEDYLSGKIEKRELIQGGNWKLFRSKGELQRRNDRDKMACVTFSACNVIETYINYLLVLEENEKTKNREDNVLDAFRMFGLIKNGECNISDRYIAKLSNTTYRGNSQKNVAHAIRHFGLVCEQDYPYVSGWNEYYKTVPTEIVNRGKELLDYIEFNYEWVNPVLFNKMLTYAPIQTSVFAWGRQANGIYTYTPNRRNHATVTDNYALEQYRGINDSYIPFDKKVAWNFNLGWGMQFTITPKNPKFNETKIKELIQKGFNYILRAEDKGQVYKMTDDGLVYLNPQELVQEGIKNLADNKKLIGISEELYKKLIV